MEHIAGEDGKAERWSGALQNLSQMGECMEAVQKVFLHKAVYLDGEAFAQAAANARQARNNVAQERRIKALEKELDAAISAARHARSEKKKAEVAQLSAEGRCKQAVEELENTTQVFKLHMEEMRGMQEKLGKKDSEIQLLKAIIQTMKKK